MGPIKINPEGKANLEVICKGSDQLENNFSIKLIRKSDYDVGVGETIYIYGTGRYKSLVDRKCKYAIKYIKEVTKGFYRHICKWIIGYLKANLRVGRGKNRKKQEEKAKDGMV